LNLSSYGYNTNSILDPNILLNYTGNLQKSDYIFQNQKEFEVIDDLIDSLQRQIVNMGSNLESQIDSLVGELLIRKKEI